MTQRLYILILILAGALFAKAADDTNEVTNAVANATATNVVAKAENTSTNAPETTVASREGDVTSFDEFKIITQRNIFDPNRRAPGRPGRNEDRPKPTRIDYLNLVGSMSYEKGRFAFFDGSSSEYRKSVKPGDSIAGYKVADVAPNKVTLESGDKKVELPVGGQLKRIDEGEWKVNASAESFAGSTTSSNSSSSSSSVSKSESGSSDEENPVLKRLLEQRRQGK